MGKFGNSSILTTTPSLPFQIGIAVAQRVSDCHDPLIVDTVVSQIEELQWRILPQYLGQYFRPIPRDSVTGNIYEITDISRKTATSSNRARLGSYSTKAHHIDGRHRNRPYCIWPNAALAVLSFSIETLRHTDVVIIICYVEHVFHMDCCFFLLGPQ